MSYATTMFWDKSIFSYIFQLTKVLIHMANYLILGIMPFTFGSKSTLNCNVIWAIQLNWVLANHYHHASWFSLSPWCQQIICSWRNKDHGQYHHQNCFWLNISSIKIYIWDLGPCRIVAILWWAIQILYSID